MEKEMREKIYKVICETAGNTTIVYTTTDRTEAYQIAEVLNEGARSNPRSTAFFYVSD
ncbi:MAG: hypothetical protein NC827_05860 [Candidatus Omnitrophica bacterium]|nr:hypothetical protein [Candidatus Omnitrophota bacterium]